MWYLGWGNWRISEWCQDGRSNDGGDDDDGVESSSGGCCCWISRTRFMLFVFRCLSGFCFGREDSAERKIVKDVEMELSNNRNGEMVEWSKTLC